MKRCPECRRDYSDDTLLFCLEDGAALVQGTVPSPDEPQTAILPFGSRSLAGSTEIFEQIIGRERELGEIKGLLCRDQIRLLTLTGVGGTGKTSLAKVVAREVFTMYPDGVFFVELSSITDQKMMLSAIAEPIGIREAAGLPALDALKTSLRYKKVLLVLDNFEQVVSFAPDVGELISSTQFLKVLVTSRVRLNLKIENELAVPPLGTPPQNERKSLADIASYDSVKLFIERAVRVNPNFVLAHENASTVAEICANLEGLPLALELAAVKTKILSPKAILERLTDRLGLLTGGARDLPDRQRTMRNTIAWSYESLSSREKLLFSETSVFCGGFSYDAADFVCSGGSPEGDLIELLGGLVDKSLLSPKLLPDGESRFRMLALVRDYAQERLTESPEASGIYEKHADYFLSLSEDISPKTWGSEETEWFDLLERDRENFRAAIDWCYRNTHRFESGLRIAVALWRFWWARGYFREGCDALERGLANRSGLSQLLQIDALWGLSWLSHLQGRLRDVERFAKEILELSQTINHDRGMARGLRLLGRIELLKGEYGNASETFRKGLGLAWEADDKILAAELLNSLGEVFRYSGDLERAAETYEESLELNRNVGNRIAEVSNLVNLGLTALASRNVAKAERWYRESLDISVVTLDRQGIVYGLEGLACVYQLYGESERAVKLFAASGEQRKLINLAETSDNLTPIQWSMNELRNVLGKERFDQIFSAGKDLSRIEAIDLARRKTAMMTDS